MPLYHVWVSQLRTIDIVVEADTQVEAEGTFRRRLGDSPGTMPWLDSATVIRSAPSQPTSGIGPSTRHRGLLYG